MRYFLILLLMSSASFADEISFKELISNNRVNLNKIELNMTKEQVKEFMGSNHAETGNGIVPNPYKKKLLNQVKNNTKYFIT